MAASWMLAGRSLRPRRLKGPEPPLGAPVPRPPPARPPGRRCAVLPPESPTRSRRPLPCLASPRLIFDRRSKPPSLVVDSLGFVGSVVAFVCWNFSLVTCFYLHLEFWRIILFFFLNVSFVQCRVRVRCRPVDSFVVLILSKCRQTLANAILSCIRCRFLNNIYKNVTYSILLPPQSHLTMNPFILPYTKK